MKLTKAAIHIIFITSLSQLVVTDFDCQEIKVTSDTCPSELTCLYQEDYEQREGYSRRCRCKTVISDLPLPKKTLKYSMFRKICSQDETRLQQLWIVDAELEYIDNEIFGKYPNLKYLSLAGNNLIFNFSEEAATLTQLDVSNNRLYMLQPDALKNLKSLKMVNASFNRLEQVNFCFKEVTELEEVYLNNNQLTNILKNEFDHLYKLRVLNLANNFLSTIDSNLFFLSLQELYLNNNKLSRINKQDFIRLPNLKILKIGDNLFTDLGKKYNFDNVEEIHCENNKINVINRSWMNVLHKLKLLNLSHNQLENIEANTFSLSKSLKVVDVSSNKLKAVDSNNFQNLKNVSVLNFSNNSLNEKVISCDNMQNLENVNELYLSFNEISEIYNCTFAKLKNLTKLSLLANQLTNIPPAAFSGLSELQELNLAENQITDVPEGVFDNLHELTNLNISYNNLTKLDLSRLNNNHKITEFDIKGNSLTNLDLKLLRKKMPTLRIVDFDRSLVKCDDYNDILEYFDDDSVIFLSCRTRTECCMSNSVSGPLIAVITVSVIIGLLALVGLYTILRKCLCAKCNLL